MEEKKEHFAIEGMSCASCVAHVEKATKKVEGVLEADVNLLTNSMDVTYKEPASIEKIEKSVAKAGYKAVPSEKKKEKEKPNDAFGNREEGKKLLWRLIPSFLILIPLFYIGMGSMLSWPLGELGKNLLDIALIELLLSISIILLNIPFFVSGFKSLYHLSPNMDSLVAMASTVSFIYSLVMMFLMNGDALRGANEALMHHSMNLSFESAGMVPSFVLLGKMLEAFSKGKTTNAIASLLRLAPKEATLLKDGQEVKVLSKDIKQGDLILVRPGESFAIDGVILEGASSVNESSLTGESLPILKEKGKEVYSGTINIDGLLKVKATKVGEDTTLHKIVKLVEQSAASKPKIAVLADRISSVFIPSVFLLSLLVFGGWMLFGGEFVSQSSHANSLFGYALERAISVLVIACPCALGLATPVATMVSSGKGAKNGLLFKNAKALEETGKCRYVVFDKTGTLTKGEMVVTDLVPFKGDKESLLAMAAALEKGSEHPLAKAILKEASAKKIETPEISSFKAIIGKGVEGRKDGVLLKLGKRSFIEENASLPNEALMKAKELSQKGKTILFLIEGNEFCGLIAISDEPKEDAKEAILLLKEEGYTPVMLTGDNEETAKEIAQTLGIEHYRSSLLPEGKVKAVGELKKEGKVLMVGDGINDAPALMQANVGIAIGKGTDIAIESADIVLTRSELKDVVKAIHLSRLTTRNIAENLFWAFFYNLIMIPIAAGAYSALGLVALKPWMGAAAMSLSSVSVVMNALRINAFHLEKRRSKVHFKEGKGISCPLKKEDENMEKFVIGVDGMMCEMCAKHVKDALQKAGFCNVEVSLSKKEARFEAISFDEAKAKTAIEEAGYQYTGRK